MHVYMQCSEMDTKLVHAIIIYMRMYFIFHKRLKNLNKLIFNIRISFEKVLFAVFINCKLQSTGWSCHKATEVVARHRGRHFLNNSSFLAYLISVP